ncbi:histone-lysine N-methyltransferase SETMAR [Trichonephila clavipes]|nr:histone-lysine N-methyltransferase SETMAR [Trichonephila clavipes]
MKKKKFKKVVLFQQDNARPHVSAMTSSTLYPLEWDLMQHPPYSPDMALSDYYLQLHLNSRIFHSSGEVINEVDRFLDSCTSQFFTKGIEKLPKHSQTIIDMNEDYCPH